MSWKVANIRLELDEPEQALPEKLAGRLGVGPRRDRPLPDPPQEPRRPPPRRPPLRLRGRGRAPRRRGLAPAARAPTSSRSSPSGSTGPSPGPSRWSIARSIIGAGPGRAVRGLPAGARRLSPADPGAGPGRQGPRRRRPAGSTAAGPLDPESNYLFGEGGAGTFSDGKLTSRNTGPDVRRVLEILADCHGKPSIVYEAKPAPRLEPAPADRPDPPPEVRGAGRRGPVLLPGRGPRHRRRPAPGPDDQLGLRRRPTSPSWPIGHSARDTYGMLLRRGVPLEPKPFQLGVRIEQPQEQVNVARHGAFSDHPALGAAEYNLNVRAGAPRPVHLLHVPRRVS